jgi:hypothetical protein
MHRSFVVNVDGLRRTGEPAMSGRVDLGVAPARVKLGRRLGIEVSHRDASFGWLSRKAVDRMLPNERIGWGAIE